MFVLMGHRTHTNTVSSTTPGGPIPMTGGPGQDKVALCAAIHSSEGIGS